MRHWKPAMMSVAASGLLGAAPAPVELAELSVLRGVKPGLWHHVFTTIPKNPAVANQQEKGCISETQLKAMLQQSLADGPGERHCPITINSNGVSKAQFTMHCPSVTIPSLGIAAPGAEMPAVIEKTEGQEHWVVSVKTPAVPGITPAATWWHEYRRLGDCSG